MDLQRLQIIEGVGLAGFASKDQTRKNVADIGAMLSSIEV
jgi:hypothetical protein